MSRIVVPVNVLMGALPNQGPGKNAATTVFELHTYVAHTAPAAAAKGGE